MIFAVQFGEKFDTITVLKKDSVWRGTVPKHFFFGMMFNEVTGLPDFHVVTKYWADHRPKKTNFTQHFKEVSLLVWNDLLKGNSRKETIQPTAGITIFRITHPLAT